MMSDLSAGQTLHDIFENRFKKISFCLTVARIRSFHVNNKPVGYTSTNTPRLVHRLSFSLTSVQDDNAHVNRRGN